MENNGNLYQAKGPIIKSDFVPLNEHPTPLIRRENFLILNGYWNFEISKIKKIPNVFKKKILVPYAVESPLSGIHQLVEPDDYLIYSRHVKLDKKYKNKYILLHFEGVDQTAEVYINKKLKLTHAGGYTRFVVKFPYLDEFDIDVIVKDVTDKSYFTRGKQSLNPHDWIYSSSSGIIKSVWLESVNDNYIKDIIYQSNYDKKEISIEVITDKKVPYKLNIDNKTYNGISNSKNTIKLDNNFTPWDLSNPYLYRVKIKSKDDEVNSYFGIRKIEIKEHHGFKTLFLNNTPIFLTGLLNQGYYYLGDLTPRSYKDYEFDIKESKALGFNVLRVHAKVEDDFFYYLSDKYGMLIIQDFPNGGYQYNMPQTLLPRFFSHWRYEHIDEEKTGRGDEISKECFKKEIKEYIERFKNNPSIIIYTIFNEAWGEFAPNEMYQLTKKLDHNQHLYDTASGWLDADSDFYSIHSYSNPGKKRIDKYNRVFIMSEVGGYGFKVNNHSLFEGYFSHFPSKTKDKLQNRYETLFLKRLLPQIKSAGLNGIIYTQLTDCESEYNGIYTFDRKVLKINAKVIKEINQTIINSFNKFHE